MATLEGSNEGCLLLKIADSALILLSVVDIHEYLLRNFLKIKEYLIYSLLAIIVVLSQISIKRSLLEASILHFILILNLLHRILYLNPQILSLPQLIELLLPIKWRILQSHTWHSHQSQVILILFIPCGILKLLVIPLLLILLTI
jgi:hypothetical protein